MRPGWQVGDSFQNHSLCLTLYTAKDTQPEHLSSIPITQAPLNPEFIAETRPEVPSLQRLLSIPPLSPVYLPFGTQHRLFVHLQALLEAACYEFGHKEMPQTLQHNGWECAEAAELNRWTEEFLRRKGEFPNAQLVKRPLEELFRSIASIRHTAVHRIRVSTKRIGDFLLDAETLALLLGQTRYTDKIAKLRREMQTTMEELQGNRHLLRSKLDETLRGIAAQRAELSRLEEAAIAETEKEDWEYQKLAGLSVQEAIEPSEASFSTAIDTEKETALGIEETDSEPGDDQQEDDWVESFRGE